jgi:uncharacterized protein
LILATSIVFVAAIIQGSAGIGYAITTAPLLRIIVPEAVPVAVMVSALAVGLLMILRERTALSLSGAGWVMAGRIPGAFIGAALLAVLPATVLDVCIGIAVLLAVLVMAQGVGIPFTTRSQFLTGVVSGTTGTATAIGGPPLAMLYRERQGPELRSTLAAIMFVGLVINLVTLAVSGQISGDEVRLGLLLAPGAIAGFFVSSFTRQFLDGGQLKVALLVVSSGAALSLLAQTIL